MVDVTIPTPEGGMGAYLGLPAARGPWPGVVVIHDALGVTTDLRQQAAWLADNGYLAVAPDLYHRGGRLRCLFATMRALPRRAGPAYDDIDAARAWLQRRPDCTGRIGVIGFCMGGSLALAVATTGGYDASSVNYGDVGGDLLATLAGACPIVASYGARDRSLRGAAARLEEQLSRHRIPHDVKLYPEAGHGFLNQHAPGETPAWALVAGRLVHTGYHEPSARDARRRILAFFGDHLSVADG